MKNDHVSDAVVRRLPQYYRCLQEMQRNGVARVSSRELSERLGFNASQIRQDLNCFGGFGQQGYGYQVDSLKEAIKQILGLNNDAYQVVLLGAGHIGQALMHYPLFPAEGFNICAAFDTNIRLIGTKVANISVYSSDKLEKYLMEHVIDIGIIATPNEVAQPMADILSRGGVKAILNFASTKLVTPESVSVENVHVSDSLFILSYRIQKEQRVQGGTP